MESHFLKNIGLENLDIGYLFLGIIVLILILLIISIFQIAQNNKLKKRFQKFMQGKNAESMEEQISSLCEDTKFVKNLAEGNSRKIKELFQKQEGNYQKCGIVKYDAFKEMGGKLSFCLVLLDERNDGFILNSVHSTEGCYSYTKRIKNGGSDIALGEEEKVALERAMAGK